MFFITQLVLHWHPATAWANSQRTEVPCTPTSTYTPDGDVLGAGSQPEAIEWCLPGSAEGVEVRLRITIEPTTEYELLVYATVTERDSFGTPLCATRMQGDEKACRFAAAALRGPSPSPPADGQAQPADGPARVTIYPAIVAVGDDPGEQRMYQFAVRALEGPILGESGLYGGDADETGLEGSFDAAVPGPLSRALVSTPQDDMSRSPVLEYQRVHRVVHAWNDESDAGAEGPFLEDSLVINVASVGDVGVFSASVYSQLGLLLSASERPALLQDVLVPAARGDEAPVRRDAAGEPLRQRVLYVVVQLESELSDRVPYRITRDPVREFERGAGYLFLRGLSAPDYRQLSRAGACETESNGCLADAFAAAVEFVGSALGQERDEDEPVVVFFGLDDVNTIRVLDQDDPWRRTLGTTRDFWAVYLEDDETQFDTSIGVRFRAFAPDQAPRFDVPPRRGLAGRGGASRRLRIGIRKFRVQRPPVNVEVRFVRYGRVATIEEWTAVYGVAGSHWWDWGAGVFLGGTNIQVARVALIESGPPGFPATHRNLSQLLSRRQGFLTGMFKLPVLTARAAEGRLWAQVLPKSLSVGIGLPPTGDNAYLLGVNWPIVGEFVHGTVGLVFKQRPVLTGSYRVADLLPLTPPPLLDEVATKAMIRAFTFGVTFDLVAVGRRVASY